MNLECASADNELLYTTAEITVATGLQRGTVTNRAHKLGFERNGFGYTLDQIMQIIQQPTVRHRKDADMAEELREKISKRIAADHIPMALKKKNGRWALEYTDRPKRR